MLSADIDTEVTINKKGNETFWHSEILKRKLRKMSKQQFSGLKIILNQGILYLVKSSCLNKAIVVIYLITEKIRVTNGSSH